jgi:hypothetical protein
MIGPSLRGAALCGLLLISSCGRKSPAAPDFKVAHLPPTPKDLIEAVFASNQVGLNVSPTCSKVGTEPSDATIGRYLAGFLAEMQVPDKVNWVDTTREAGTSKSGEPVWICNLTLHHKDGDDVWSWGVRFQVRQSDGLLLSNSFECTGAG